MSEQEEAPRIVDKRGQNKRPETPEVVPLSDEDQELLAQQKAASEAAELDANTPRFQAVVLVLIGQQGEVGSVTSLAQIQELMNNMAVSREANTIDLMNIGNQLATVATANQVTIAVMNMMEQRAAAMASRNLGGGAVDPRIAAAAQNGR